MNLYSCLVEQFSCSNVLMYLVKVCARVELLDVQDQTSAELNLKTLSSQTLKNVCQMILVLDKVVARWLLTD